MKWSFEDIILILVELILIVFFCISIYNLIQRKKYNHQDLLLKTSVDIGIESVLIFISFFTLKLWYTGKLTHAQKRFCLHISPFLMLIGITTMIPTIQHLKQIQTEHN